MVDDSWYTEMADAIKTRDHAASMIKVWETKRKNAEDKIQDLREGRTLKTDVAVEATEGA